MSPRDSYELQIFSDKLSTLYSSNRISTAATLTVASVYVFIQLPSHHNGSLFAWLALLATIYTGRFFLTSSYFSSKPPPEQLPVWLRRFRLAILLTGLTMGSTIVLFYPFDDVPRQMFTVLILAGLSAGGLTVLVADLISFRCYVVVLLVPVILISICTTDRFYLSVGVLVFIFLLIILRASRRLNDIVTSSLQLRYENLSLVNSLEQEKKQLNNRLGRILNDSSNELYIADARTLTYLQVNKGALDNLGYTRQELFGMTLLDVIADLDEKEFTRLVQPLRSNVNESVICKTIQKRKDGSRYPVELRFQLSTQESPAVFVVTALDITERDEAERKLIYQANFDQLTKLPNRYYIHSHIDKAFARARRQRSKIGLLFMDLNNFKDINDTLGHGIGDKLLKQVAARIRATLREADTPARLGGDEFLVMLEGLEHPGQAEIVVHKLNKIFHAPFKVDSHEIYTSASIGISIYPDDGKSVDLLMQYADTAMYYAKQEGGCDYRFFSHELRATLDEQHAIESRLRHAVKNNELSLFYQPKIDIKNDVIVGAEALVRWYNPELGNVPPNIFIPIAEKYGLINTIGSWILQTACREASTWREISPTDLHVAVNISPQQFRARNFLDEVDRVLEISGLPETLLEFEITENLLMQDTKEPLEILNHLRGKNITLSLDDFGTGYSSLSYLKRFPIQVLKIDRSFIQDMLENQFNMSLVDAIIAMAQSLGLCVVAEGVETGQQLSFLRRRNVEIVQGYFFSPPVPAREFRTIVRKAG